MPVEQPMADQPARRTRRDAVDNRARILSAAGRLLADRGGDVDVRQIARAAGVGTGTLYRHFPTKRDLVAAVIADTVNSWATAVNDLAQLDDPQEALHGFMEETLRRHAEHRGLLDTFRQQYSLPSEQDVYRQTVEPTLIDLVKRGQRAHVLRDDLTADDVALLLLALGRVIELSEDQAPGTWRRILKLSIEGLAPPA